MEEQHMSERNEIKQEYWNTLYDLDYAYVCKPTESDLNISEDEIPEDIVINPNGDYMKCAQILSSDKIQILNQIKNQKLLESIDNNLKTIKKYISITFWISVCSGCILVLSAIIKLL